MVVSPGDVVFVSPGGWKMHPLPDLHSQCRLKLFLAVVNWFCDYEIICFTVGKKALANVFSISAMVVNRMSNSYNGSDEILGVSTV